MMKQMSQSDEQHMFYKSQKMMTAQKASYKNEYLSFLMKSTQLN